MAFRGDAVQRAHRAFEARCDGYTWEQVAERVGYSEGSAACRAVSRYVTDEMPDVDRLALTATWRERTEWLWAKARADVVERRPSAVTHAVRVVGIAMQLDGLATKPPATVTGTGGFEDLIKALTAAEPPLATG